MRPERAFNRAIQACGIAVVLLACTGVHAQQPVATKPGVHAAPGARPHAPTPDDGCVQGGALCWRPRPADMTTPRGAIRWWVVGALPLAAAWYPLLVDGVSPVRDGVPLRTVLLHGVLPWVLAMPVPLVAALSGQLLGGPMGCLVVGTVLHIVGAVVGGVVAGAASGGPAGFLGGLAGGLVGRGVGSVVGAVLGAFLCGALAVAPVVVPLFLWQKLVAPATLTRAWDAAPVKAALEDPARTDAAEALP